MSIDYDEARRHVVVELKKKALAAKHGGDLALALAYMKQSKTIESSVVPPPSLSDDEEDEDEEDDGDSGDDRRLVYPSLYWRKVAVLYTQSGDQERAGRALARAKRMESKEGRDQDDPPVAKEQPTPPQPPPTIEDDDDHDHDDVQQQQQDGDVDDIDDVDIEMDVDVDVTELDNVTFTVEEMMDEEMMAEFCSGGMPVPSHEQYGAKILECKKLALSCKQGGDVSQAMDHLRRAKQLEKVQSTLQAMAGDGLTTTGTATNDGPSSWMDTLNAEESELLGELMMGTKPDSGPMDELGDDASSSHPKEALSTEEMESMDDGDLFDFVDMMGLSSLPTVKELEEESAQYQKQALEYKQSGNIDMAKRSLLNSKRSKAQADRIGSILRKLQSKAADGDDLPPTAESVNLEELEALADGNGNGQRSRAAVQDTNPAPPPNPWLSKPSAEIKLEVVRLKDAKQVKEATELLQILKRVVQKEKEEAELERRREVVQRIEKRLGDCDVQVRLWQYYWWFVDAAIGFKQYTQWTSFASNCKQAVRDIQTKGSESVGVSAGSTDDDDNPLLRLDDDAVDIVERGIHAAAASSCLNDTSDPGNYIEVSVLGVFNLHDNEKLRRVWNKRRQVSADAPDSSDRPSIRVDAKVQLPLHPDDPSQPVHIQFHPTGTVIEEASISYTFDPRADEARRRIYLPKPGTKQLKTIVRRTETKAVQVSVYLTHDQRPATEQSASRSWLFRRDVPNDVSVSDKVAPDTLLGKATVEIRQLLARNCITGDVPLMMNAKKSGGTVRLAICTARPMDPEQYVGNPSNDEPPRSVPYRDGLVFDFLTNQTKQS
jgi:hypothetical protein